MSVFFLFGFVFQYVWVVFDLDVVIIYWFEVVGVGLFFIMDFDSLIILDFIY